MIQAQADYYQANGQFWQGLATHSQPPADGQQVVPDRLWSHPTDQAESWLAVDLGNYISPLQQTPYLTYVDVYEAPAGAGFVACMQLSLGGSIVERCVNYGPETWRYHDWQVVQ